MTIQGAIILEFLGLGLIILMVQLVRANRLRVGFALIWLLAIVGTMIMLAAPVLLAAVTRALGALFPASALTFLALGFIVAVLLYHSVQLSTIATRQTELIQSLALRELAERDKVDPASPERT